ncbi:glucose 1-dehydrogenase [Candidatus Poribacteria bacterium]|nr:glucose 1-dehydrogenase [Candidatus Poribacteria bacterium]
MNDKQPILQKLFSLEGKSALVTGASSGIGQALAIGLTGAGAEAAINGRNQERLEETRSIIESNGGRAVALPADLRKVETCRKLVADANKVLGKIDILINCAGMNRRKPITEATEDDFDTIVAVNLRSIYFLSQAVYPIMCKQGGGKIVNIGSINIFYGLDTVSVYGLSKGGVGQLTKVMAVEWAKDNIQVNCVTPGFIRTPLTEHLWRDDEKAPWFRKRIRARRPGTPEELVGVTIMLSSNASSYITGENITVDGGFLAGGSWFTDELQE